MVSAIHPAKTHNGVTNSATTQASLENPHLSELIDDRERLSRASDVWGTVLVIATVLLVVGISVEVIGDIFEVIGEIKLGKKLTPFKYAILTGAFVVVVSCALEGLSEFKNGVVESNIRKDSSEIEAISDSALLDAKGRADKAKGEADFARAGSEEAIRRAVQATKVAQKVTDEVVGLAKTESILRGAMLVDTNLLTKERTELEATEKEVAPRRLADSQLATVTETLKGIAPDKVYVIGRDEEEPRQLADQFWSILGKNKELDAYAFTDAANENWSGIDLYIPEAKSREDAFKDPLVVAFERAKIPFSMVSWGCQNGVTSTPSLYKRERTILVGQKPVPKSQSHILFRLTIPPAGCTLMGSTMGIFEYP